MKKVLIVDGANVVGARPDGWWKDRAGAAVRLHDQLMNVHVEYDEIVLVLEGQAKQGVPAGRSAGFRVVHAPRDGDSTIAELAESAARTTRTYVVTADRALGANVSAYATVVSPSWLLGRIEAG